MASPRHHSRKGLQRNVQLPAEAAALLVKLRENSSPRLNPTLERAWRQGWTLEALAEPLGVTRERIRQRASGNPEGAAARFGIEIPPPPKLYRSPKLRGLNAPRVELDPETQARMRALHAVARTVNGATQAEDPRRQSSVELSRLLAHYVQNGVTKRYLAQMLGVYERAISSRLEYHGYTEPMPSVIKRGKSGYVGHATHHPESERCKQGHLRSENRYPNSPGCRSCNNAQRRKRYHERKTA